MIDGSFNALRGTGVSSHPLRATGLLVDLCPRVLNRFRELRDFGT
jgi:hypothetical protein